MEELWTRNSTHLLFGLDQFLVCSELLSYHLYKGETDSEPESDTGEEEHRDTRAEAALFSTGGQTGLKVNRRPCCSLLVWNFSFLSGVLSVPSAALLFSSLVLLHQ
jgi:hypothetical protein